jgi:hypothetical protein
VTLASEHTFPHPPQFEGSVVVLTQVPAHGIVPDPHVAPQTLPLQSWPIGQFVGADGVEHAPQFVLSLRVSTSQPFAAFPSQSAKPLLQLPSPHTPVVHTAEAFANAQRIPHPPQFITSLLRTSVSQPFNAMPSQSPNPVAQAPTTQCDAAHAGTPTFASAHAFAHEPQ